MAYKDSTQKPRPTMGQDVIRPKSAQSFPSVGVSLPSYKKASSDGLPAPVGRKQTFKQPGVKTKTKKSRLKRFFIGLTVLALLAGGWYGGRLLYNAQKLFGGSILSVLQTSKLKGEDSGRVTILLAGNSADDVGHLGAELTDSIMLISIDTKQKTAYTLSIPRDLYVDVPDSGYQKINSAYVTGKENDFNENSYPTGGMGQLDQVLEQSLNIKIHYYALVNYNALKQAVDAVGGIDFTVKSEDPRGIFDPNIDYTNNKPLVKLPNGTHRLNGQQALNLARARGDSGRAYGFPQGDFDRASNQRQMLTALKSKAVSAGVLSNPNKLSNLADAIGNNVTTDLTISEVRRLYDLTKDIGNGKITSASLNDADGVNLLANYTSRDGQSTLIPAAGIDDYSDIQRYLKRLNSSNPVVREAAKVVVLNATDTLGLAGIVRASLTDKNINVVEVGDAVANQATNTIIAVNKSSTTKPGTQQFLIKTFGNTVTTTNPYADQYDADFIVVVGANEAAKAAKEAQN